MSKDYMTGGLAAWITYQNPTPTTAQGKNPWENALGRNDQFAPIADAGGIALFRKQFTVTELKAARIDATALGVFDIWVNGRRVGRTDENGTEVFDEMKPGWTDYAKRVLYYSYDLAPYLVEGENTLLIAVAPGWYNGRIALNTYGETHIAMLAAIHLVDGEGQRVLYSDDSWQGAWGSAIRASDIWDGELYDANLPTPKGLSTGCNCITWDNVTTETHDIFVTPHVGPTIMVREGLTRKPQTIVIYNGTEDNGSDYGKIHVVRESAGEDSFKLSKGESAVIDLGQNMVGWPTFTVKGAKPHSIPYMAGTTSEDMAPPIIQSMARRWIAKQEKPSYTWLFDRQLPGDHNGAWHSFDLWYWFGTLENSWRPMEQKDFDLSQQMVAYLENFLRKGNPNKGGQLPTWVASDRTQTKVMILGEKDTQMGRPNWLKMIYTMLFRKTVGV